VLYKAEMIHKDMKASSAHEADMNRTSYLSRPNSEVQMDQQEPVSFIHYKVTATLFSLYVLNMNYQTFRIWVSDITFILPPKSIHSLKYIKNVIHTCSDFYTPLL